MSDLMATERKKEMENKVTVLVGNGFNYFVNHYMSSVDTHSLLKKLEEYKRKNLIQDEIILIQLQNLQEDIERYCNLLDFLKLDTYSESGETLLSKLNAFFKSLDKSDSKISQNIVSELSSLVSAQINAIFDETSNSDDKNHFKYINATVKTEDCFFSTSFENIIKQLSPVPYNVYTTNYDYIIGSVFSEKYNTTKIANFKEGGAVYNIHGHYKQKKTYGEIVCCAPELKKSQMKADYFQKFKADIEKSTIIILFGIGLTSDPHLLKELNKKMGSIVILIDANKERYYNNHYPKNSSLKEKKPLTSIEFQFLKNNRIYFIDTNTHLNKPDFLVDQINTPEKLIEALTNIATSILKLQAQN